MTVQSRSALLATLVVVSGLGARAQPPVIPGDYGGNYECEGRNFAISIVLKPAGAAGAIEGLASLPFQRLDIRATRAATTPLTVKGKSDGAGAFEIMTDEDVQLTAAGGARRLTLRASARPDGFIVGEIDYPGCRRVVLARRAGGDPFGAAMGYAARLKAEDARGQAQVAREQERAVQIKAGWVPVELRPAGGPLEEARMDYFDATLDPGFSSRVDLGVAPIDEVHQSLYDRRFVCLTTNAAVWNGTVGSARSPLFGRKSYLVECAGACRGLMYELGVNNNSVSSLGAIVHAGKSRPYPVLTITSGFYSQGTVEWRFRLPATAAVPPSIRVHTWSDTPGDNGGGCQVD